MARHVRDLAREIYKNGRAQRGIARARQVARSSVASDGSAALEVVPALNAATSALRQAQAAALGDRSNLVSDPTVSLPWGEAWDYLRDEGAADTQSAPRTFDSVGPWEVIGYDTHPEWAVPFPADIYWDLMPAYRPVVEGQNGTPPPGDWYGMSVPYIRATAVGMKPGARYRWSADLAVHLRSQDFAFIGAGAITNDLYAWYDEGGYVSERLNGTWFAIAQQRLSVDFIATGASMPLWIGLIHAQMGSTDDPEIASCVWFRNTFLEALPPTDPNKG